MQFCDNRLFHFVPLTLTMIVMQAKHVSAAMNKDVYFITGCRKNVHTHSSNIATAFVVVVRLLCVVHFKLFYSKK